MFPQNKLIMLRFSTIIILFHACCSAGSEGMAGAAEPTDAAVIRRPNIVLMMADDMGMGASDRGCRPATRMTRNLTFHRHSAPPLE